MTAVVHGHHTDDLIRIFAELFADRYHTILVKGGEEPVYLPRSKGEPYHRLIFAHGFFASALHEIAHWCIAGIKRRKLVDFGYWYRPDGRTPREQAAFERVEIKPQAMEWIFATAAGHRFVFSADNLDGTHTDMTAFRTAVHKQVHRYLSQGLPKRAHLFKQALLDFYQNHDRFGPDVFTLNP